MKASVSSCFIIPIFLLVFFCETIPSETAPGNSGLITKTCKRVAKTSSNIDYATCVTSLQSARGSKSADLRGLAVIASNLALINATRSRRKAENLRKKALDRYNRVRLEACEELYSDAISELRDAAMAFRSKKDSEANILLSAAYTDADTCEDSFAEMEGHVSPLTKQNKNLSRLCVIGLAISKFLGA
ncbi:putative invertase inhibitor [Aristolochia californica]|uniref:putative invertase inhibitor n=1 Tax=Aristolochia californica TaxID=171875 RepID=UPI0035DD89E1